jgi:hypothetical protein
MYSLAIDPLFARDRSRLSFGYLDIEVVVVRNSQEFWSSPERSDDREAEGLGRNMLDATYILQCIFASQQGDGQNEFADVEAWNDVFERGRLDNAGEYGVELSAPSDSTGCFCDWSGYWRVVVLLVENTGVAVASIRIASSNRAHRWRSLRHDFFEETAKGITRKASVNFVLKSQGVTVGASPTLVAVGPTVVPVAVRKTINVGNAKSPAAVALPVVTIPSTAAVTAGPSTSIAPATVAAVTDGDAGKIAGAGSPNIGRREIRRA